MNTGNCSSRLTRAQEYIYTHCSDVRDSTHNTLMPFSLTGSVTVSLEAVKIEYVEWVFPTKRDLDIEHAIAYEYWKGAFYFPLSQPRSRSSSKRKRVRGISRMIYSFQKPPGVIVLDHHGIRKGA